MIAKQPQLKRLKSNVEAEVTPRVAVMFHLALIGIPIRFGFVPLWDSSVHPWLETRFLKNLFPSASSLFNGRILLEGLSFSSPLEEFSVHEMGWHLLYPYELSFVAWFVLRKSESGMNAFHKTLTICSVANVTFMSMLQCLHPSKPFSPFEHDFFVRMLLCHLLAISFSTWTLSLSRHHLIRNPSPELKVTARWSLPGMALFFGSMISLLVAIASLQALAQDHGLEHYFGVNNGNISQVVLTSFLLGAYYLAVHAFLLYRLRDSVMTVNQLKYVCLYKLIVNLCVPILWLPEFDVVVHVDKWIALGLRIALAFLYGFAFYFAGTGDRIGRIMAAEKAD